MKVRDAKAELIIAAILCVTLPTITVGAAVALDASPPTVVASAGVGALLAVFWVRRTWSHMVARLVDLTLESEDSQHSLDRVRRDESFRDSLSEALRDSDSESRTIELLLRAASDAMPDADVSLLLNLPGQDRVGWTVRLTGGRLAPAIPTADIPTCRALSSGTTAISTSTIAVRACEHLAGRPDRASSVCIPLALGDRNLAAVSAICPPGEPPSPDAVALAEWAVERAAVRIAEQRLQRGPSLSGPPDPITGLPGHDALRNQLKDLLRTLVPFSIAIVAVDDFDAIVTNGGRSVADQALSFVADSLTSSLRPDDFVCRHGESEFVVVLPGCDAQRATGVVERARESLALLLALESRAAFTCSAGVSESNQASSIDELISMTQRSCRRAKASGGNRVSISFSTDRL